MTTVDEALGLRILAARDDRQAAMDRWLGRGATLITASLAIPGPEKSPPGAAALFAWIIAELPRAVPGARRLSATWDALGPFDLWEVAGAAADVKRRCLELEHAVPAARLVDLDVYTPEGIPVDRAALALPPRPCLCCPAPARACIRAGAHPGAELAARAHGLLAAFDPGAAGGLPR